MVENLPGMGETFKPRQVPALERWQRGAVARGSSCLGSRAEQQLCRERSDLGLPDVLPQPGGAAGVGAPLRCGEGAQACGWAPGPGFSSPEVQVPCSATLELQVRAVETPSFTNQLISGRDRRKVQGPCHR